jgi:hypothetical protein
VTRKEIAGKKYVMKLGDEERGQLNSTINEGKHAARQLLKGIHPVSDAASSLRRRQRFPWSGLVVTFVPKVPFWKLSYFKALRHALCDNTMI